MANSDKNIRITTSKNKTTFPNIVFTGSSAGTSVLTLEVRDDNTVAFTGTDGDVFSLDYNLSSGTIWSVNDKSGTPFLRASAGGTIGIAEFGTGVIVGIGQTNPQYKLDVQGWVGFASTGDGSYTALFENGLTTGNNAFSIRAANSLRFYNSNNTFYTGFKGAQSGVNTTYTLPPTSPAATGTSVLASTQAGILSWVPLTAGSSSGTVNSGTATFAAYYATTSTAVSENANLQFTGTGLSVGGNVQSSSTTTGSLQVRGGFAITGNAFIGGTINVPSTSTSSISSVNFTNGVITSGTWSGAPITTLYGGTGFNSYAVGDILYAATGSSFGKLPANANVGYVLTSNGANAAPSYQAVPPAAASSVAVLPVTFNQSFFITAVSTSSGTGLGLSTITSLTVNPSTNIVSMSGLAVTSLTNSSSFSTGALTVYGGLGLSANAFIGGTAVVANNTVSIGTNSGALVVNGGVGIGGSLFTGTATPSSISGVVFSNGTVTTGTWNGTAISPTYGGTGQNYGSSSGILKYTTGTASLVTAPTGTIVGTTDSQNLTNKTYNNLTITAPATSATLTIADTTTFATSGAFNLTLTTTAATNVSLPRAGTLVSTGNDLSVFASTSSAQLATLVSDETGTAGKLVFSTTPTFTTSVLTDSTTFAVFNTTATTINAFGAATTLSVGAASGTFTHNSTDNTSLPSTGSLVILGGVGIGKTVNVGGNINIFNGSNYAGFRYAGSAVTTYTLPADSPKSAVGTSVLSSTVDGVMSWIGMSSGGSATPAGSNQQIQYNSGGSFGGAIGMTWEDAQYLLTISANTNLATSGTQTGLRLINNNFTFGGANIRWSPALELVGRSGLTPGFGSTFNVRFTTEVVPTGPSNYAAYMRTKYSYDLLTGSPSYANDIFRIHSTLGVGIGASNSTSNAFSYFRVNTAQSGDVTYILPIGFPSTGTSVLQSDTTGNLSWVGAATGGGSGSVNAGTANFAAYYATSTNAVSENANLQFTGTGLSVGGNIQSASTLTGSLRIRGGVGITGNAFIGGTTTITNTTASLSIADGALVVAGGVGIGGSLNVGNMIEVGTLPYAATNVLAAFTSSVNSYNQVVVHNSSAGSSASADFVVSNNLGTDVANYGNLGINSSTFTGSGALNAPSATYVSATSGPLVLGTTTAHPIRFTVNSGATDVLYISEAGTAISVFTNLGMRSASNLRFWNSGNTFYAALQGGNNTANYIMTMPTAPVAIGSSLIVVGSDSIMYFVGPGSGIAFSAANSTIPIIRQKHHINLNMCAGFTPNAVGPDPAIYRIPESPSDGTTAITYNLRRFNIRVETPSAGSSRIQLERSSTDTGAFTLGGFGSSHLGGFGLTISGAGIYVTSVTGFSGSLVTSGNLLRMNFNLLNATHANFSVQLILEEV